MELNWSTFALEIVNFLILVWLLARFLYLPVTRVIEQRRLAIHKQLADADAARTDAAALKHDYEERMTAWEHERITARQQLDAEISVERGRLLNELRQELEQEREKAGILDQRRMEDARNHLRSLALEQGTEFCARLLTRLASPELETRIIDFACAELGALAPDKRDLLKINHEKNKNGVIIRSAFPISGTTRNTLSHTLAQIIGSTANFIYQRDPDLIAGICIQIGAWQLQANLRDELKYFSAIERDRGSGER
jgi:F-type H+-transporting ATPase subunit b